MKNLFLVLLLTITQFVFSQGEANIWYFGKYAGLDFNSGKPVSLTNSKLFTLEGCATMSTAKGRLLFYTEGVNVWDSTHNLMPNGSGLYGNISTTQAALIIPKPGNRNIFYIFTLDDNARANGLTYSELDMNLNSGKGDIVSGKKNIQIAFNVCEKIAAVMHSNGEDMWVLVQKFNTDTIYSYLVTKMGVGKKPIANATGVTIDNNKKAVFGQMKISSNGRKIACANTLNKGTFSNFIADFDPSSGKISNIWTFLGTRTYGLEFSPSGNYLYIARWDSSRIFQYDVKASSRKDFLKSEKTIDSAFDNLGSLQLGPDGKIYIATSNFYKYLHVIHAPDSIGVNCRLQKDYVFLNDKFSTSGLPNFISSYFNWINFEVTGNCIYDSIAFTIPYFKNSDSLRWDFGDPESGINNTFTKSINVFHVYKKEGRYKVSLINYDRNQKTMCYKYLNIKSIKPYIGKDTFMCGSTPIQIGSPLNYAAYYWSNNSFDKITTIKKSSNYILKVWDDEGCTGADTIFVKGIFSKPKLGNDTVICYGNSLTISPNKNYLTYKWSNESNTQFIRIADTGSYSLTTVDSFGCKEADTIIIKKAKTKADFEARDICETDTVEFINKSIDGKIFNWNFGDGNSSNLNSPHHKYKIGGVSTTFNVSLTVKLAGICNDSITKSVTVNANPKSDFTFTASKNIWNFTPTQSGNTKYRWLFGDGDSAISGIASHIYKDGLSNHKVCLKATNVAGCISETCKQIVTTGIFPNQTSGFKIYPNPNTGNFTIEIDNPEKDISIEVYNSVGGLVKKVKMVEKVISINLDVSSGIYLVKVRNEKMEYSQKVSITK